ncbi:MAG: recombinase family protein [Anaerovoracaceae bacterium]|jgi:site-specific DNA recombinase
MSNVTVIPARKKISHGTLKQKQSLRRVAGYARVSTDHEEQQSSYEAQVDYYTTYINGRDDWELAGIYTDEGISATSTKYRKGFKQMIQDALAGKIDLIITKSVSRFARNTVDSLTTVRQLKEAGIEIYFEKENIWTFDSKGELLITIMSSLAQEESRSISENVKWGHRKRFADGKGSIAFGQFLGYEKGENGEMVVNEEQAKTVRLIYSLFLKGGTYTSIARELTERGLPTPGGKTIWRANVVRSILQNEKYKGDMLLQKCYTVDFLTKKQKKNEGEIPQYYVEDSHEAIVSKEVFDLVQEEILRRKKDPRAYSGKSIFSSKIQCGECGSWYGPKVWHSNDDYRKVIYRCNHKYEGGEKCKSPKVNEEEVKAAFMVALEELLGYRDEVIENAKLIMVMLDKTKEHQKKRESFLEEMKGVAELIENTVSTNARKAQNQKAYQKEYDKLVERYDKAKAQLDDLDEQIASDNGRRQVLKKFIENMETTELLSEFDETAWSYLLDYATVMGDGSLKFTFKDGTVI